MNEMLYIILGSLISIMGGFIAIRFQARMNQELEDSKNLLVARNLLCELSGLLSKKYRAPAHEEIQEAIVLYLEFKKIVDDRGYREFFHLQSEGPFDQNELLMRTLAEYLDDEAQKLGLQRELSDAAIQIKSNKYQTLAVKLIKFAFNEQIQSQENIDELTLELNHAINYSVIHKYGKESIENPGKM